MGCEQDYSRFRMKKLEQAALLRLGRNVHDARIRRGLTQVELAELAGINQNYVSAVELGKASVSFAVVIRIAHSLRVSPVSLLVGTLQDEEKDEKGMLVGDEEADCRELYLSLLDHTMYQMDDREVKAMCYIATALEKIYGNDAL